MPIVRRFRSNADGVRFQDSVGGAQVRREILFVDPAPTQRIIIRRYGRNSQGQYERRIVFLESAANINVALPPTSISVAAGPIVAPTALAPIHTAATAESFNQTVAPLLGVAASVAGVAAFVSGIVVVLGIPISLSAAEVAFQPAISAPLGSAVGDITVAPLGPDDIAGLSAAAIVAAAEVLGIAPPFNSVIITAGAEALATPIAASLVPAIIQAVAIEFGLANFPIDAVEMTLAIEQFSPYVSALIGVTLINDKIVFSDIRNDRIN